MSLQPKAAEGQETKASSNALRFVAAALVLLIIIFAWSPWITDAKAIKAAEERLAADYPYQEPPNNQICSFCKETNDTVYKNSASCEPCFAEKPKWTLTAKQAMFGKEVIATTSGTGPVSETGYFISSFNKITPIKK